MKTKGKNNKNKGNVPVRCAISGRIINNSKEAVLTKFAELWVLKQGHKVLNSMMLIFLLVLLIGVVSGGLNLNDETIPQFLEEEILTPSVSITGNGTFNQTLTDLAYWRLDGTNSPPSATWNMGGQDFDDMGSIIFDDVGSPRISSGALALNLESALINFEGDTITFGSGIGDIGLRFDGSGGGDSVINWRSLLEIWDWENDVVFSDNIQANNITAQSFFIGNGTLITDVCKSDGSDCMTAFNMSQFNNTNIAYTNETNNFTEYQIMDNDLFIDGYLNSSNHTIDIADNTNISWDRDTTGCLNWNGGTSTSDTSICRVFNTRLNIKSSQIVLEGSTVTVGRGLDTSTNLNFDNSGQDDELTFDGTNKRWVITHPLTWDFDDFPATTRVGLIFARTNPSNNVTWNNVFSNNFVWTSPDLFFDVPQVKFNDLNITGNVNITGNITSSNDCGIPSGTFSFERATVQSNIGMATGNGDILDGEPMACSGKITAISGYCENCDVGVNEIAYELRINGVSQVCDVPQLTTAGDVDSTRCNVNFAKHDVVGCWTKTETGAVTGARCVLYARFG